MYAQNKVQVDSRCPSASSSLHLISHHKFSTGNRKHYHYLKVKSQYKMLMLEIFSRWRKEELGPLLLRGEPSVERGADAEGEDAGLPLCSLSLRCRTQSQTKAEKTFKRRN